MTRTFSATEKAAILVANLDRHTADMLLAQMTRDQASAVRRAVIELDHVDPQIVAEVLDEFRSCTRPENHGGDEVTWEPSGAGDDYQESDAPWNTMPPESPRRANPGGDASRTQQRFACLCGAQPSTVARYFAQEHPQTIAVVFSHLSPEQSADILAQLPAALQAEVLRRLADLEETDPEVLRDIEMSVEQWLQEQDRHSQRRRTGLEAIQRILASAELGAKEQILANVRNQDRNFAEQFGYESTATNSPIEPATQPAFAFESPPGEDKLPTTLPFRENQEVARAEIAPLAFEDLPTLSDLALEQIFGRAEPEVIRIALAGASSIMVQRILARLPELDQRLLRRALSRLAPMRLSDIELSQQHLAHLATELIRSGEIEPPAPSRLRAA